MPTFIGARLPASSEEQADERTCKQELRFDRDADTVAAAAAMEDLLSAHTEPRNEVLEVGHRRCGPAEHGGIERAARCGEQSERDEAAADLEASVGNVLVRDAITGDMERGAEEQCEPPRADDGSHRRARGDVQRNDHQRIMPLR
jgi:hypothetical protein